MEKLMYLLERDGGANSDALTTALLRELIPAVRNTGAHRITLNIANLDTEIKSAAPGRIAGAWDRLGGVLSLWLDTLDDRGPIEALLEKTVPGHHGYLVTESMPQRCEQSWPDGERRPGVTQFTAHGKPADVGEEDFYHNWQVRHSAISFDLHPLRWSYERNAVARALTPGAPPHRALVLEHFRHLDDFTDDSRYFGKPEVVEEMFAELPGFCDVNTMVTGGMSEYRFDHG